MSQSDYTISASAGKKEKSYRATVEPLAAATPTSPPRFRLTLDDKEVSVEARRFDERGRVVTWSLLESDGTQRLIDVDGLAPDFKVSVNGGDPITLKVLDERDSRSSDSTLGAAAAGGDMRAAMPGKVVKLLCQVGDLVKVGQGLLVIEAMKMENELRASGAGKVTQVAVREGQTVESGQALITISPA